MTCRSLGLPKGMMCRIVSVTSDAIVDFENGLFSFRMLHIGYAECEWKGVSLFND